MSVDKVRIGIVGAGWWAVANHLPLLKARPDVELVGVCRLGQAELKKVMDTFEIPFGTENFDELLASVPMDGLVVASPHQFHGVHACKALERSVHVLVEKPMAVSAGEALAIVDAAQARGLNVVVPYGWNFKPFIEEARHIVASGAIGEIRHVSAVMASPIGELMTGHDMPGTEKELFRPNPSTWSNPKTGGYGWGQLVHLLGALFFLSDLAPQEVFGMVGRSDVGADLFNAMTLRFTNGATAAVSGASTVPDGQPFQVDLRFYGSEGMLLVDVERERCSLRRFDGKDLDATIAAGEGAYTCEEPIHRFVELCKGNSVNNPGSALVGARSVEVVDAMLRSAKSGQVEKV